MGVDVIADSEAEDACLAGNILDVFNNLILSGNANCRPAVSQEDDHERSLAPLGSQLERFGHGIVDGRATDWLEALHKVQRLFTTGFGNLLELGEECLSLG